MTRKRVDNAMMDAERIAVLQYEAGMYKSLWEQSLARIERVQSICLEHRGMGEGNARIGLKLISEITQTIGK